MLQQIGLQISYDSVLEHVKANQDTLLTWFAIYKNTTKGVLVSTNPGCAAGS